jgi:hypothetical protein
VTLAPDPEAAYYQAVEEYFVTRRGESLFLSNADWNLVRKWRLAGLPLRVVLRGIRDALDAHEHGFGRDRRVGSLAYCTHEVDAARERWERALALGREEGGGGAEAALEAFACDLERASVPPSARATADAIAHELRGRHGEGGIEGLTAWLSACEERLVRALAGAESAERRAALDAEVDAALAPWRGRMPAPVLEQLRRESLARRRLESYGLPRLSLFHLEGGGET